MRMPGFGLEGRADVASDELADRAEALSTALTSGGAQLDPATRERAAAIAEGYDLRFIEQMPLDAEPPPSLSRSRNGPVSPARIPSSPSRAQRGAGSRASSTPSSGPMSRPSGRDGQRPRRRRPRSGDPRRPDLSWTGLTSAPVTRSSATGRAMTPSTALSCWTCPTLTPVKMRTVSRQSASCSSSMCSCGSPTRRSMPTRDFTMTTSPR